MYNDIAERQWAKDGKGGCKMPEISRFYGIVIKMFFKPKEHEPSHIHALYGEHIGIFDLRTMKMTEGDLPRKAQELVEEQMTQNQKALLEMWDSQDLKKLPPLQAVCPAYFGGGDMIPRIKSVKPLKGYLLHVIFDDGKDCIYNVKDDIDTIKSYKDLEAITGLFEQVQLDESRTCVFWNDYIDLPSDTIYENAASNEDVNEV